MCPQLISKNVEGGIGTEKESFFLFSPFEGEDTTSNGEQN